MRNLTKKIFAAVLALSLFAGFSTCIASFAIFENEYIQHFDRETILQKLGQPEDYIEEYEYFDGYLIVYVKGFDSYGIYRTVAKFFLTLDNKKIIISYANFFSDISDLKIPYTFFGIPSTIDENLPLFIIDDVLQSGKVFFTTPRLFIPERFKDSFENLCPIEFYFFKPPFEVIYY